VTEEHWYVEVLERGYWQAMRPGSSGEPYSYPSEAEAERIARTYYPDQWRLPDHGRVRVVQGKRPR